MSRTTVLGLIVMLIWTGSASAFEVGATLKKIDVDNGTVIVFANGQERTVKVSKDAKFLDEAGKDLDGGLKAKEIKEGAEVTLSVEREDSGPVIKTIRLGRKAEGGAAPKGQARQCGPER